MGKNKFNHLFSSNNWMEHSAHYLLLTSVINLVKTNFHIPNFGVLLTRCLVVVTSVPRHITNVYMHSIDIYPY